MNWLHPAHWWLGVVDVVAVSVLLLLSCITTVVVVVVVEAIFYYNSLPLCFSAVECGAREKKEGKIRIDAKSP